MTRSRSYPYGISKLQGERAVLQLAAPGFSVIALRQGTVCGWSARMRFDLIVNMMYRTAMSDGVITVNNPAIWRPVLDIRDAVSAFTRPFRPERPSGMFNVASGNFTVGQVADLVKDEFEERLGRRIRLDIRNVDDIRNYTSQLRARTNRAGLPAASIRDIVADLHRHADEYGDFTQDVYYNIAVFKQLASDSRRPTPAPA